MGFGHCSSKPVGGVPFSGTPDYFCGRHPRSLGVEGAYQSEVPASWLLAWTLDLNPFAFCKWGMSGPDAHPNHKC